LTRFTQSRGVVSQKRFVNQIRNGGILLDRRRIDAFTPKKFALVFITHLFTVRF
jgi:hypothetical protein